jgi:hypothetical protein
MFEIQVEGKLSLCFFNRELKAYWWSRVIALRILVLGTRWKLVVSFTLRSLCPRERVPATHWIGGWVGPRASLDAVVKRKIPSLYRESEPRSSIP